MQDQNYKNHSRLVPLYHGVLYLAIIIGIGFSTSNLVHAYHRQSGRTVAALLLLAFLVSALATVFARLFPLKAQDRAIRAEENLRYFSITGKLLDPRLSIGQVIALRFAPDEELVALAKLAAEQNLKPADIKKAINNWRADHHRV